MSGWLAKWEAATEALVDLVAELKQGAGPQGNVLGMELWRSTLKPADRDFVERCSASLPWAIDAQERLKAVHARMLATDPMLANVIDTLAEGRRR